MRTNLAFTPFTRSSVGLLFAAGVCALALLSPAAGADRTASWANVWTSLAAKPAPGLDLPPEVKIVAVPVDPTATRVPGVLAAAWPQYEDAIEAVRSAIASDPHLTAALDAKGVGPDKVIGLNYGPNGRVVVYVTEV